MQLQRVLLVAGCLWMLACQSADGGSSTNAGTGHPAPDQYFYSQDEELARVERDTNGDGRVDRWDHFEPPNTHRIDLDSDYDGIVDLWASVGWKGKVLEVRRDSDGDGRPDQLVPIEEAPFQQVDPAQSLDSLLGEHRLHEQDCMKSRACRAYMVEFQDRVSRRWSPTAGDVPGSVTLRFRIAADGHVYDVEIVRASNKHLARTTLKAIEEVGPLPAVPEEIRYLTWRSLIATFHYALK